jgi:hypothetical protein
LVVEHDGLRAILPPDGPLPRADAVVAIGQRARLGPASGGEAGAALAGITASGLD